MRQKLVFEQAHFDDRLDWVEEEELDQMDSRSAWEMAFERGVEMANNEIDWYDDDE